MKAPAGCGMLLRVNQGATPCHLSGCSTCGTACVTRDTPSEFLKYGRLALVVAWVFTLRLENTLVAMVPGNEWLCYTMGFCFGFFPRREKCNRRMGTEKPREKRMTDVEIGREEVHEGGSKKEDSPVAEECELRVTRRSEAGTRALWRCRQETWKQLGEERPGLNPSPACRHRLLCNSNADFCTSHMVSSLVPRVSCLDVV